MTFKYLISGLAYIAMTQAFADVPSEEDAPIINDIRYVTSDVFDVPEGGYWLYQIANRLHINTRESTIRSQLLFKPGEDLSPQKIAETERLLRRNDYLFDASIAIEPAKNQTNKNQTDENRVDVVVNTRDNWTLFPEFSYSRSGGENKTVRGIEDRNIFGTGTALNIRSESDNDRDSRILEFSDRNLGDSWVGYDLRYADLSDGESSLVAIQRPFYSFDARWASGTILSDDDRVQPVFSRGERVARYRQNRNFYNLFYGFSDGLRDGKTERWTLGYVFEKNQFSDVTGAQVLRPENRELAYPYIRFQSREDLFEETRNLNQIGKVEDVYLGSEYSVLLGYAPESNGSNRSAAIVSLSYQNGYGSASANLLLLSATLGTRIESGTNENTELHFSSSYYVRQSSQHVFFASANFFVGDNLDADNFTRLGGETGLRGYPIQYLNGQSSALLTVEQRFYTKYEPFQLFRIGAAIFVDAGRVWGEDTLGFRDSRLVSDIGFGLRVGNSRAASNRTFHIDVAFPLSNDSSVDSVQFQIEGKTSF